jgi:hypothetical protein
MIVRQLQDTKEQHELRVALFEIFSAKSGGTDPADRDIFKEMADSVPGISCEVLQLYLSAMQTDEDAGTEHLSGIMGCTLECISDGIAPVPKPADAEHILVGVLGIYTGAL